MLTTYKAVLTANQIQWLETPPRLSYQPLMVYITLLPESSLVTVAVEEEDALLQLAGSIQSAVTDVGIRHDEYLGQSLVETHDETS